MGAAAALAEKTGATVLLKRTPDCHLRRGRALGEPLRQSGPCYGRERRRAGQRLRLRGSTERRPTAAPPGWGEYGLPLGRCGGLPYLLP